MWGAARALLSCSGNCSPSQSSASRHRTMADKKKPTVKELPTKVVPTKDADKVKGGKVNYNF